VEAPAFMPGRMFTLGLLHALKGVGNRAFYRWLTRDGTGSVSCNSVFVLHLCRFLNQEDLMEREAMVQNP